MGLGKDGPPDTCDRCGCEGRFLNDLFYLYDELAKKALIVHSDCRERQALTRH